MKYRSILLVGVIIAMVGFTLITPEPVDAVEHQVGNSADGFHMATVPPGGYALSTIFPSQTIQIVFMDAGDDIKVTIDHLLSVNNAWIGPTDYTQMDYTVDFYQVNSNVNIASTSTGSLIVTGGFGTSAAAPTHTYSNLGEGDSMRIDIDLDLYVYLVPPGVGVATLFPSTFTLTVRAI